MKRLILPLSILEDSSLNLQVNLSVNHQQHHLCSTRCEDINKPSPAASAKTAKLIIVILMAMCHWC